MTGVQTCALPIYHDPALAIVDDQGEVLFAEATERYLQNKRALSCAADPLFYVGELLAQFCPPPCQFEIAINWRKKRPPYENVVNALGLLSAPGLLRQGFKRLRSPLGNYQLHHMIACQRNHITGAGINLVRHIREHYPDSPISFADYDHHLTHAAMACYSSPFDEAACAVIDSFGENGSMAFYHYEQGRIRRLHETRGTGSIGFYYMKITELCGFDWIKGEEWKVMGLAPYGKLDTAFYELLKSTIQVDGFDCKHTGRKLFSNIDKLTNFQRRKQQTPEQAADIAYTGQYFFAELMSQLLRHLQQVTGSENLTLAGGCALNSAFNGQISERTDFTKVHIPSAPADDGTALGAAWLSYHRQSQQSVKTSLLSPFLGARIDDESVRKLIEYNHGLKVEHLPDSICQETARLLAQGKLVAWVQGRAEYGPRALGNRSILADPRAASTKDRINQEIKFREQFRPFAPSVLHEFGDAYFENYQVSPYMDKTLRIRENMRDNIAAVCHVDGTGRLQTVKQEWNPRFHQLLQSFYQLTEVPVLLNTSFNIMGKPLVHSLEDCLGVFLMTGLDALVVNDYLITSCLNNKRRE